MAESFQKCFSVFLILILKNLNIKHGSLRIIFSIDLYNNYYRFTLLTEYAFILRPQGIIYTITDVEDLHNWMVAHLDHHPLFQRLSQQELDHDPCVAIMASQTEEGKKVSRNNGKKIIACYRRLDDIY